MLMGASKPNFGAGWSFENLKIHAARREQKIKASLKNPLNPFIARAEC